MFKIINSNNNEIVKIYSCKTNKTRELYLNEKIELNKDLIINVQLSDGYYKLSTDLKKNIEFMNNNINNIREINFKIDNGIYTIVSNKEFNTFKNNLIKTSNNNKRKYFNIYWQNLHWLSVNYPEYPLEINKQQIRNLIYSMRNNGILCSICLGHFIEYTNIHNIENSLNSRDDLFRYFYELHNEVNNMNKNKIYSYQNMITYYQDVAWGQYLPKFGTNIIDLFYQNQLGNFPSIHNTVGINKIKEESTNNVSLN